MDTKAISSLVYSVLEWSINHADVIMTVSLLAIMIAAVFLTPLNGDK